MFGDLSGLKERLDENKLISKYKSPLLMKTSSDGKNKVVQPVRKTHVTVNESNFARR